MDFEVERRYFARRQAGQERWHRWILRKRIGYPQDSPTKIDIVEIGVRFLLIYLNDDGADLVKGTDNRSTTNILTLAREGQLGKGNSSILNVPLKRSGRRRVLF